MGGSALQGAASEDNEGRLGGRTLTSGRGTSDEPDFSSAKEQLTSSLQANTREMAKRTKNPKLVQTGTFIPRLVQRFLGFMDRQMIARKIQSESRRMCGRKWYIAFLYKKFENLSTTSSTSHTGSSRATSPPSRGTGPQWTGGPLARKRFVCSPGLM